MPTTHLQALNIKVSKTNQDSGSGGFINLYYVYELFCQAKKIIWCKWLYYFF